MRQVVDLTRVIQLDATCSNWLHRRNQRAPAPQGEHSPAHDSARGRPPLYADILHQRPLGYATSCDVDCDRATLRSHDQGRSHVSKIGGVYLSSQTNVQLQRSKASGEEWEGCRPPRPTRESGGVASSPRGVWGEAPAANDFGAFHVQLYAISRIFSAFNSCLVTADLYIPLPASRFDISLYLFWVSDTPNLNFWGCPDTHATYFKPVSGC